MQSLTLHTLGGAGLHQLTYLQNLISLDVRIKPDAKLDIAVADQLSPQLAHLTIRLGLLEDQAVWLAGNPKLANLDS